ncbi:unnamed protein product [Rotaria sordida]|uniref:Uncharacterized protein n=1 Tax=Rotaria sordida TaxID=392033 RepID=A0A813PK23_9BILA|nr:unnamed protein product [Rotaria sordida]CAF0737249.1 unnamed protein product [Rotaria sordida]CAF0754018.1 unnamed protein product [Rotaria sordida]CAF0812882.1 unnamed protein product [Rotaria sordida]CAF3596147.1 unnamed protein product [Rotaria sordida]
MSQHRVICFPKYFSSIIIRSLETAVWIFAESGIADHLAAIDAPQTAKEMAQKQGWDSEFLYRILRTVANADNVREIKSNETIEPEKINRVELTEDGRFLTSNHSNRARYLICWKLNPVIKIVSHYLPNLTREDSSKGNSIQQVTNNNESMFDYT